MRYYEDMIDKYGFNDGAVPPDAEKLREVYIYAINKRAKALGSTVEAYAYDRGGCHNWCLILYRTAGSLEEMEEEPDKEMEQAIGDCYELPLDEYFVCTTKFTKGWKEEVDGEIWRNFG